MSVGRRLLAPAALSGWLVTGAAGAFSGGPPALRAGDPDAFTCVDGCHDSFALGAGDVMLELLDAAGAPAATYRPGLVDELVLRVRSAEPGRLRWGFEVTALSGADRAGAFEPVGGTRVLEALGRQYLSHAPAVDDTGGAEWTLRWRGPRDAGTVAVYACANAANGDETNRGDFIECDVFELEPAVLRSRLVVTGLDGATASPDDAFASEPCTRVSDLRTCAEADGVRTELDDPVLPAAVEAPGRIAYVELDSDLDRDGGVELIEVRKADGGPEAILVRFR